MDADLAERGIADVDELVRHADGNDDDLAATDGEFLIVDREAGRPPPRR
jgi:hypothetical protein